MNVWPVILCGGAGRRLWPLSRPDRPKPLLPLGGEPLLLATARRFDAEGFDPPCLVAGQSHADAMATLLPSALLVEEPVARGTAAAVAVAALLAPTPETLVLISPADHVVQEADRLREAIWSARAAALDGALVTFGIVPTRAATEYGWIQPGEPISPSVHRVRRFLEKPDAETAERLLQQGDHLWNAGLFLFRADVALQELRLHAPEVLGCAEQAVRGAVRTGRLVLDGRALSSCPSLSFDVAVMEKTGRAAVRPVACGWSDVGTWDAVAALGTSAGPVTLAQSPGAFAWSDGPQVVVLGAPGVRVVATGGAVLVSGPGQGAHIAQLPPPADVTLDRGPSFEVLRRSLARGAVLELASGEQALVVGGGALVGPARWVADQQATVVIVRR